MKKIPQFELNLGKDEPLRLVGENGKDFEREQNEREKSRRQRIESKRAQWWFEQMRKATESR